MKQPVVVTKKELDGKLGRRSRGFHDWASWWARPYDQRDEALHGHREQTGENRPAVRRARFLDTLRAQLDPTPWF